MAKDVLITPASGLIDFKDAAGTSDATIQLDDLGNLNISNTGGDLTIGNTAADVYIGNGVANVDLIFEQDGDIRALTGKTLTLGSASSSVNIASTITSVVSINPGSAVTGLNLNNNNIIAVNNLDFNDPGPNEGISWSGGNSWKIYESPNDLTTNGGGNLQIVQGSTRRATFNTSGQLEIPVSSGAPLVVASTTAVTNLNADLLDGNHATAFAAASHTHSNYISAPADFGSQTAKTFLAAPNGAAGNPSFRAIVASDIPTLNQNTTGNAGTVTNGVYTTGNQTIGGNKTFSDVTTLDEVRYENANTQSFHQIYNGGATGSYFDGSDWQEICTVTPTASSQNYQVIGRIAVQSGGNTQIIYFQAALRSNTLPDLSWTITYWEEISGGVRYADPVLWVKETTTASFKLALKGLTQVTGTITVDLDVINRSNTYYGNTVFNTNKVSEVSAIPSGYTEYAFTKNYALNQNGVEASLFTGGFSGTLVGNADTATTADLLDGYHAADFPRKAEAATVTGDWTFEETIKFNGSTATSTSTAAAWFNAGSGAVLFDDGGQKRITWNDGGGNFNIRTGNYFDGTNTVATLGTGDVNSGATHIVMTSDFGVAGSIQFYVAGVTTAGNTVSWTNNLLIDTTASGAGAGGLKYNGAQVWHADNDGAASGLDADLLDGNHATAFALTGQTFYLGTTAVAINRASAIQSLTGISGISIADGGAEPDDITIQGGKSDGNNGQGSSITITAGGHTVNNAETAYAGDVLITGGSIDAVNSSASPSYFYGGDITLQGGNVLSTDTTVTLKSGGSVYIDGGGSAAGGTAVEYGDVLIGTKTNSVTVATNSVVIGKTGTAVKLPGVGTSGFVKLGVDGVLSADTGTYLSTSTTSTQNGYFGNIYLYDDSTPSHYLAITNSANLTAARTLSVNVNNADRTVSLSGNLTVSAGATISGTNTGDNSAQVSGSGYDFNSFTPTVPSLQRVVWNTGDTNMSNSPNGNSTGFLIASQGSHSLWNAQMFFEQGTGGNLWIRGSSDVSSAISWGTWAKVWTSNNDGSGSGLDADTLDGVNSTGFARIGTTAPTNNYLYTFRSGSANPVLYVRQAHTSGDIARFFASTTAGATSGTSQVTIEFDGSLTATGNVTAYSDLKLKTDLVPISSALSKVQHLTGYTFTRKDTGKKQTGLVAQEVQAVLPEAVVEKDGYLSLAYGNLVGLLVEAIKEQQVQIDSLKKLVESKL